MGVIEIDWRPDRHKLRQFAIVFMVGLDLIGLLAAWKLGAPLGMRRHLMPIILWAVASGVGMMGLAIPDAIKPVYCAWMAISLPIGWIVSHLALASIYFLVFTPIALIFRALGRDAMCRKFDRTAGTYWVRRCSSSPAKRYFQQF
jgi:hypothetical protein